MRVDRRTWLTAALVLCWLGADRRGIYEVGGDALKICLFPASEANTHPAKGEARGANRSSIYLFKRDAKQAWLPTPNTSQPR